MDHYSLDKASNNDVQETNSNEVGNNLEEDETSDKLIITEETDQPHFGETLDLSKKKKIKKEPTTGLKEASPSTSIIQSTDNAGSVLKGNWI